MVGHHKERKKERKREKPCERDELTSVELIPAKRDDLLRAHGTLALDATPKLPKLPRRIRVPTLPIACTAS